MQMSQTVLLQETPKCLKDCQEVVVFTTGILDTKFVMIFILLKVLYCSAKQQQQPFYGPAKIRTNLVSSGENNYLLAVLQRFQLLPL